MYAKVVVIKLIDDEEEKRKSYSPGTSPVRYSGISDRSNRPSGKKILLSGPETKFTQYSSFNSSIV